MDPHDRSYSLADLGLHWRPDTDMIVNPHTRKSVTAHAWRLSRAQALDALGWRPPGTYTDVYSDYDPVAGF